MRGGKTHKFPKCAKFNVAIMQERHKNHVELLDKRSEGKPMENNKRRKPQEFTSLYDLEMTLRMRRLSCNGSIQSTFKNPPF